MRSSLLLVCLASQLLLSSCFFHDTFENDNGWVHASGSGKMVLSSGKFKGDQGYKTSEDAKFYHVSKKIGSPVDASAKDLVISFSVTHEQNIDCGGGYLKFLPDLDQASFNGDSAYNVMFGPDICGATKKIHLIFGYNGKNLLWKKEPRAESDTLTHFYTVVVKDDDTYEVYVDFVKKESGKLEDDWDFLPPKQIADPTDKKPSDWVDEAEIVDPEDKKPADWDTEPATIPDPDAAKPDDWDEEEDGEWEAPTLPNPKHKGEWKARRIANPKYKGEWKARMIANPDYQSVDLSTKVKNNIAVVGVDVWQVKSGSIFDNILITDSFDTAKKHFDAYKSLLESEKQKEADSKKEAETPKSTATDEDEDEDEDEEEETAGAKHDEL